MIRRLLTSVTLAGLVVVGLPAPSGAMVADQPEPAFPSFDGTVRTTAHRGSTLYVGGDFAKVTDASGEHTRHGAAAIDTSTGLVLPWNPNVRGSVRDLAVAKEGVYLAGSFTRVKSHARTNLARVSRTGTAKVNRRFHPIPNGPVNTITRTRRTVLIGGDFTRIGRTDRSRLAAITRTRPFVVTRWNPRAQNGDVLDIVKSRAGIYVAGEFRSLNGRDASQRLALVTRRTGATVESFNPATSRTILDIARTRTRIYAAVGGPNGGGASAIARGTSQTLWERRFDGDVQAIAKMGDHVYVGGHFNLICAGKDQQADGDCEDGGTSRLRGASLTEDGVLSGWNPRFNSALGVTTFDTYPRAERLVVGGAFTTANSGSRKAGRIAVFDRASTS